MPGSVLLLSRRRILSIVPVRCPFTHLKAIKKRPAVISSPEANDTPPSPPRTPGQRQRASERAARKLEEAGIYIAAADKLVQERFDARAGHLLSRHLLQRRTLYAHAMGAGDFRTALAAAAPDDPPAPGPTRLPPQ